MTRPRDEAVEFYSKLFDVKVNKGKPLYANFVIERPPLKLVLFGNPDADERLNGLGVEVLEDAPRSEITNRHEKGLRASSGEPRDARSGSLFLDAPSVGRLLTEQASQVVDGEEVARPYPT
jgi:hypothetical protein